MISGSKLIFLKPVNSLVLLYLMCLDRMTRMWALNDAPASPLVSRQAHNGHHPHIQLLPILDIYYDPVGKCYLFPLLIVISRFGII